MADAKNKSKSKSKKVTITEEDVASLLERYSPQTILTLLQEVGQVDDVKFDWNELVKKTKTGITNPREYQMVWRHLAYMDTLSDDLDNELEPLDDDSDLETELEAFPAVSAEASAEAAACAKVLLGSGLLSDTDSLSRSTVEAPLTINIPCQGSTQGKNIIVPVCVPRLPLPGVTSTEGLEGSGPAAGGLPARRKRKPWTEEEDMELIAAVQKCGERNWANILKGDFKGDRTASQLSQRWAIIRKRQANLNSGAAGNPANSQLTEAQLATRRAVSHALNMPIMDNLLAACSGGATQSSIPSNLAAVPSGPEDTSAGSQTQQPLHHKGTSNTTSIFRKDLHTSAQSSVPSSSATVPSGAEDTSLGSQSQQLPQYKGIPNITLKSRVTTVTATKGPSVPFKSFSGPNPTIEATAVAAGARIATPSTAASLLKAAQSKNVVHIRPGGGSLIKIPITSVAKSSSTSHLRSHPNVHYIRTGLTPGLAQPTYTGPSPSIPRSGSIKQDYNSSTRPPMVTCSLPLNTTSTLPTQQMMSGSSASATLCGSDKGKKTSAISTVDTGLLSKEVNSEEKKEGRSMNESHHAQVDFPKLAALTENQTTVVEKLKQTHNVDAGENKPLLVAGKESESSNIIKDVACSTTMDED